MNPDKSVPQNTRDNYPERARQILKDYYNAFVAELSESSNHSVVTLDDIYMVSGMKVLQHWKGTFGTTNKDGLFFEITFNGDKDEIYVDQYVKVQQLVVKGAEPFQLHSHRENLNNLPATLR